ncbi:aldehyde dehydrogenase family protein [Thalassospira lucentensis]|uniref:aldehyde dehydrogenase family protein n=1 Tax=Thalassospira lucentensis TaxID=168935 RepID=UPI003D2F44AA
MSQFVRTIDGVDHYSMFINGAWTSGHSTDVIEVENPATETVFATIPNGTAQDALDALETAKIAQVAWAKLPSIERGKLVFKLADAIDENRERMANIIVAEQGKPLDQAYGEVGACSSFLRYAAENARRIEGDIMPSDSPKEEIWIRRLPYGVVVGLTAWNYPAALATRKLGPALIAGNSFVLKAHEFTPVSGLELARLAHKVGIPDGVFNVVTGAGRTVGEALVNSPVSNLVTMTGSNRAGREIYASGADQIKVLRLELGGKAPFIVMEDADIDAAVKSAITARFTNCGQICTCNERMYLQKNIADEFTEKFITQAKQLTIGQPLENPDLGPKVSGGEIEKIEQIVADAVTHGAEFLLKGGPLNDGNYAKGHWYAPSVLRVPDQTSALIEQEIFGPVVPIAEFDTFDQVMTMANDTPFGLSAYVYTQNFRRVMSLSTELNFGEIYVNRTCGELVQGFHTGWGHSGLGGEDGKYGFDGYLRKKSMYVNWS